MTCPTCGTSQLLEWAPLGPGDPAPPLPPPRAAPIAPTLVSPSGAPRPGVIVALVLAFALLSSLVSLLRACVG